MARWRVYAERVEQVDTSGLLRSLARDVARDAAIEVAKRTGRASQNIDVTSVSDRRAIVTASPENPRSSPGHREYGAWLERGTSRSEAKPYLRPATYRYRAP